jgi:hypothetical protein
VCFENIFAVMDPGRVDSCGVPTGSAEERWEGEEQMCGEAFQCERYPLLLSSQRSTLRAMARTAHGASRMEGTEWSLCATDVLLVSPAWVDPAHVGRLSSAEVNPVDSSAADALVVNGELVYLGASPRAGERLRTQVVVVHNIDLSELANAWEAVTGCSLIVDTGGTQRRSCAGTTKDTGRGVRIRSRHIWCTPGKCGCC